MKRLLLLSSGLGALPSFFNNQTQGKTLAFVPTAANPYEDKWFVESDRSSLHEMGFSLRDIDLTRETVESLRQALHDVDGVYITDGNTFYLLDQVRKSGFDTVIIDLIEQGLPYIGASAGAVLAGPNTAPVQAIDDKSLAPDLTSTAGLGLVEFVPLPHAGKEKYAKIYEAILNEYGRQYRIVPMTDQQATVVVNSEDTIVESL